jgi:hypothetical protein
LQYLQFGVNVAIRATDVDTNDVKIESQHVTERSCAASFILSLKRKAQALCGRRNRRPIREGCDSRLVVSPAGETAEAGYELAELYAELQSVRRSD